jgi:hypothetical protein
VKASKPFNVKIRIGVIWRHRWVRVLAVVLAIPTVCLAIAGAYYYVSFARVIDARLHGERDRVLPRVFARPFELRRGQSLTERQLVDRLNDLGYAQRAHTDRPGEFAVAAGAAGEGGRPDEIRAAAGPDRPARARHQAP